MSFIDWSTFAGLVTVAGFLWRLTHTLNRDMHSLETRVMGEIRTLGEKVSSLGERVARIEGVLSRSPINEEQ